MAAILKDSLTPFGKERELGAVTAFLEEKYGEALAVVH